MRLGANAEMSQKNIMSAILQTKGPIVTHQVVRGSWRFLRHVTSKAYLSAATRIANSNLGSVVDVNKSHYFVKRPPHEVVQFLTLNPGICNPDYYTERYRLPTSSAITRNMRNKLIDLRIVPHDFF